MTGKSSRGLTTRIEQARQASAELNKATDDLNHRLSVAERDLVSLSLGVSASIDLEVDSANRLELSLMKHNSQWGLFVSPGRDPHILLKTGVEGLAVRAIKGPTLSGDVLLRLAERLFLFERILLSLDTHGDAGIIGQILHAAPLRKSDLRERKTVEAAVPLIRARLEKKKPNLLPLTINVAWESKDSTARISIAPPPGATARPVVIDSGLLGSPEYEELYAIEQDVRSIGPAPYFVHELDKGTSEVPVEDADALWAHIEARGRKGAQIRAESFTSLLKCSREIRVAAATKLAELVEQLIRQVEIQKDGVQQSIHAVDALLQELHGGAT